MPNTALEREMHDLITRVDEDPVIAVHQLCDVYQRIIQKSDIKSLSLMPNIESIVENVGKSIYSKGDLADVAVFIVTAVYNYAEIIGPDQSTIGGEKPYDAGDMGSINAYIGDALSWATILLNTRRRDRVAEMASEAVARQQGAQFEFTLDDDAVSKARSHLDKLSDLINIIDMSDANRRYIKKRIESIRARLSVRMTTLEGVVSSASELHAYINSLLAAGNTTLAETRDALVLSGSIAVIVMGAVQTGGGLPEGTILPELPSVSGSAGASVPSEDSGVDIIIDVQAKPVGNEPLP